MEVLTKTYITNLLQIYDLIYCVARFLYSGNVECVIELHRGEDMSCLP